MTLLQINRPLPQAVLTFPHCFINCHVSVFRSGLYVTLKTIFVIVPVGLDADDVPPLPPPPDELLLDELPPDGRARLPMTLNVTVKASLPELLNFRVRAPETSAADKMLSMPTVLL